MQVGGPPSALARAQNQEEVLFALEAAEQAELPIYPLGGGSNVIVADDGVQGCVLLVEIPGITFEDCGENIRVTAGAGMHWDAFVQQVISHNLQGVECLSGIPGAVGATPIQNVGAYGQEVSQVVESVTVMSRKTGKTARLSCRECQFAYRDSIFKRQSANEFVVLSVTFRLSKTAAPQARYGELAQALETCQQPPTLAQVRKAVLSLRKKKAMVLDGDENENRRSCGSFFLNTQVPPQIVEQIARVAEKSPPSFPAGDGQLKVPSAWLIEQAGFHRGMRKGPVGLSTRHTLCVVAHDGARAADIVDFAWTIRQRVEDIFQVTLMPEPQFWGFSQFDRGLPVLSGTPSR